MRSYTGSPNCAVSSAYSWPGSLPVRDNISAASSPMMSVFVSGPHRAVEAKERSTRAFFPAKTQRAVEQSAYKPLESDRNLHQPASKALGHEVDHAAADQRLAHSSVGVPAGAIAEQIIDR